MPVTMYGFREHLSTHDVLLQLHELLIKGANNQAPRAILTVDLNGAFDNVTHVSMLHNLNKTGSGEKIFKYYKDFLRNHTAVTKTGEERSQLIEMGDRGTPQGSVISPMLFNLAFLPLPAILDDIHRAGHALYAGNITKRLPRRD